MTLLATVSQAPYCRGGVRHAIGDRIATLLLGSLMLFDGDFLVHGSQHFSEGCRGETGGVIGHGIGNDQFAVVHESTAGINDIRNVPLTLALIRLEQGFTQAADHFAGIVAIKEECADAVRSQGADTMAEDQPACFSFNGGPAVPKLD